MITSGLAGSTVKLEYTPSSSYSPYVRLKGFGVWLMIYSQSACHQPGGRGEARAGGPLTGNFRIEPNLKSY